MTLNHYRFLTPMDRCHLQPAELVQNKITLHRKVYSLLWVSVYKFNTKQAQLAGDGTYPWELKIYSD